MSAKDNGGAWWARGPAPLFCWLSPISTRMGRPRTICGRRTNAGAQASTFKNLTHVHHEIISLLHLSVPAEPALEALLV